MPGSRGKLIGRTDVKTFLRELERILGPMSPEQRRRVAQILGGLINGLAGFKDAIPGLPAKATAALIADLTMYMSMGKKGPEVFAKAKTIAKEKGMLHVEALLHAI